MKTKIQPVILCGGSGKRLWPASRADIPKPFLSFGREKSLFDATLERVAGEQFNSPLVVTTKDCVNIVMQNDLVRDTDVQVIVEPDGRNTAASIMAASIFLRDFAPDAIMLVLPSDHQIENQIDFRRLIIDTLPAVEGSNLVLFGVTPSKPHTGYGYIRSSFAYKSSVARVLEFLEKPSEEDAKAFVKAGDYLWNTGIFFGQIKTFLDLGSQHIKEQLNQIDKTMRNSTSDDRLLYLDPKGWDSVRSLSFDKTVVEKAKNVYCCHFHGMWSDLGDWETVLEMFPPDERGNRVTGNSKLFICSNSSVWSDDDETFIEGVGVNNLVIVKSHRSILVADKSKLQLVKEVADFHTDFIESKDIVEHRPWGCFRVLQENENCKVKSINVLPHARLSLQSHKFRSENWVVVEGTATVTVENKVISLNVGESVFIPAGAQHRLHNNTNEPLTVVETQTGTYFGEDDITRYQDDYSRSVSKNQVQ